MSNNLLVPYGPPPTNVDPNNFIMHVNPKFRNMPPPNFQLSNCSGRKRALLIGINYFGTSAQLKGKVYTTVNFGSHTVYVNRMH